VIGVVIYTDKVEKWIVAKRLNEYFPVGTLIYDKLLIVDGERKSNEGYSQT
jgi:hypothetical protein